MTLPSRGNNFGHPGGLVFLVFFYIHTHGHVFCRCHPCVCVLQSWAHVVTAVGILLLLLTFNHKHFLMTLKTLSICFLPTSFSRF